MLTKRFSLLNFRVCSLYIVGDLVILLVSTTRNRVERVRDLKDEAPFQHVRPRSIPDESWPAPGGLREQSSVPIGLNNLQINILYIGLPSHSLILFHI